MLYSAFLSSLKKCHTIVLTLQLKKIEYQMKNVNHIVWADLIRVIAILMVICIHCSDPFNVSPEARLNPEYNLWGSIYGAFLRPCVPLFVMLTGMLLLPVEQEIGQFYKKGCFV